MTTLTAPPRHPSPAHHELIDPTPRLNTHRPEHRIAVLVPEGFSLLGLGAVLEVFGRFSGDEDRGWYEVVVCSMRPGNMAADGSLFCADILHGAEALAEADTVVVPEWRPPAGATPADQVRSLPQVRGARLVPECRSSAPDPSNEAVRALRRAHAGGARLVSWGSGTELLAEAGLLDRREVAVHWAAAAAFARRFPAIRMNPRVLYVDGGDIVTAAGTATSLDVCLHLLRRDRGAAVAQEVAGRLSVGPHREGSHQQLVRPPVDDRPAEADPISDVMAYVVEHLDDVVGVPELARRAYMSTRHFSRRFRAATGTSPTRWIASQRLLHAQRLLETSTLTVEQVATAVGFSSPVTFRQHFVRQVGMSPTSYRRAHSARTMSSTAVKSPESDECCPQITA